MTRAGTPLRPRPGLTIGPPLALAVFCWALVASWMGTWRTAPGADPGSIGIFTAMWALMMAAMMLPSVWPTLLVYRRLQAARRERDGAAVRAGAALLLAGYLAAWTAVGLVGFAVGGWRWRRSPSCCWCWASRWPWSPSGCRGCRRPGG
ncbi:MAG: DUF2182 domain-containing protein [Pseudonocardia sp.]